MIDDDDPKSQATRRRVLRNDASVRASTLSQFAQSEANEIGGRFSANERATVVGANPLPNYPAAFLQLDPVPDEPPLGFRIDALDPFDPESSAGVPPPMLPPAATDDLAAPLGDGSSAPSGGLASEQAGSSFSSEQTNE